FLAGGVKELSKEKATRPLADLVEDVQKSLEKAELKQAGSSLSASVSVKIDTKATAAAAAEAAKKVKTAAARMQSSNNLKQFGLAMHTYLDQHGTFPPAAIYDKDGKALLSWRVLLLPYIEADPLYKKFKLDEPWDSAHNKKLLA